MQSSGSRKVKLTISIWKITLNCIMVACYSILTFEVQGKNQYHREKNINTMERIIERLMRLKKIQVSNF